MATPKHLFVLHGKDGNWKVISVDNALRIYGTDLKITDKDWSWGDNTHPIGERSTNSEGVVGVYQPTIDHFNLMMRVFRKLILTEAESDHGTGGAGGGRYA